MYSAYIVMEEILSKNIDFVDIVKENVNLNKMLNDIYALVKYSKKNKWIYIVSQR